MKRIQSRILLLIFLELLLIGSSFLSGEKVFAQTPECMGKEPIENWSSIQFKTLSFKIPHGWSVLQTAIGLDGKSVKTENSMTLTKNYSSCEIITITFLKGKKIDKLKNENISGINRFYNKTLVVDEQPALDVKEYTSKTNQFGQLDNSELGLIRTTDIQFGSDIYELYSGSLLSPSEEKNSSFDKILSTFKFTQSTTKSPNIYTVKKGDTLWDIAGKVYKDNYKWPKIAEANDLVNPSLIHPGNIFVIPTLN